VEISAKAASARQHPLSKERAADLASAAWSEAFYPAFVSTPHPDDDPQGEHVASGQRAHLQMLLGLFARSVAVAAVDGGLYPDVQAFFDHAEDEAQAVDPPLGGVERACAGGAL